MRTVNKIALLGIMHSTPKLEHAQGGKVVSHFELLTEKRAGGAIVSSEVHRITVWNKLAEFVCDSLAIGDAVYVEGRLEYGLRVSGGMAHRTADVVVREVIALQGAALEAVDHG